MEEQNVELVDGYPHADHRDSIVEEGDQAHELEQEDDPIQQPLPKRVVEDLVEVAVIDEPSIVEQQAGHGGQQAGMLEDEHLGVQGRCLGWGHHWKFDRSEAIAGEL